MERKNLSVLELLADIRDQLERIANALVSWRNNEPKER